jgi:hypothetical protein
MDAFASLHLPQRALVGVGAARDVLDVTLGDAQIIELAAVEAIQLAHGALVLGELGDTLTNVHFGPLLSGDLYLGVGTDD